MSEVKMGDSSVAVAAAAVHPTVTIDSSDDASAAMNDENSRPTPSKPGSVAVWAAFSNSGAGAAGVPLHQKSSVMDMATFSSRKDDTYSLPSPKPFPSILRTPTPSKPKRAKTPNRNPLGNANGSAGNAAAGCVKTGSSIHEGCICRYKQNQNFSFQPEVGQAPPTGGPSIGSARRGSSAVAPTIARAMSTPQRHSVIAGVHDSPCRRANPTAAPPATPISGPISASLAEPKVYANAGVASAVVGTGVIMGQTAVMNSMGTGITHITTPDVLSPSLTALTASAASKRKSRSPLPGRRAAAAAAVAISLETPIRSLPFTNNVEAVAASASSSSSSAAMSTPAKQMKDSGVQTSPDKDTSQLAKQLQLQLLRTAAEHKKLEDLLAATETKAAAESDDTKRESLETECEDIRLKMRAVRDVARDTISLMERLNISRTLPAALNFLAQYEEADREDDDDQADEDAENAAAAGSPSKSRSKRKKQKTDSPNTGADQKSKSIQKFTFSGAEAAATAAATATADGLPLSHQRGDEHSAAQHLSVDSTLLPPPSSVQLVKSPHSGATSNADFPHAEMAGGAQLVPPAVMIAGMNGGDQSWRVEHVNATAAEVDELKALLKAKEQNEKQRESESDVLKTRVRELSADAQSKSDALNEKERALMVMARELTQQKIAQMKYSVRVAKYHFANQKRSERWLSLSADGSAIQWAKSQNMSSPSQVLCSDVKEILHGAHTMALKNRISTDQGLWCVSLVLAKRTLDLCFQSQATLDLWLFGLKNVCKYLKVQPQP